MRGHDDVVVRSTRGEFRVHPFVPSSFKSGVPFFKSNKKERVPSTNDDDDDDDVKKKRTRVAVVVVVVARWCRYNDPSPNTPPSGSGIVPRGSFCDDDDDDDRARGYVVNGEEEEVLF